MSTSNGTASTATIQQQPIGTMLTLMKTAEGEFVLSGHNAQQILLEYFSTCPEFWLRLMAIKAERDANKESKNDEK